MNRWKENFEKLLEAQEHSININLQEGDDQIIRGEIEEAIKKCKTREAPGYDKIKPEMIKEMGEERDK